MENQPSAEPSLFQRSNWIKALRLFLKMILFTALLAIGLVAATFIFAWVTRSGPYFGISGPGPWDDRRFDSAIWKQSDGKDIDSPRGQMLYDLLYHSLKVGLSKSAVLNLLGKTDTIYRRGDQYNPFPNSRATESWHYPLGNWSGFRVDTDFLVVEFDKSGVVTDIYTYQS